MRDHSIGPVIRDDLFERLNVPHPGEYRVRVDLAYLIVQECSRRGLKQRHAAELLEIGQPDYSKLANAKIEGFSQERLEKLLNRLDLHVRIQVGPTPAWAEQAGVAGADRSLLSSCLPPNGLDARNAVRTALRAARPLAADDFPPVRYAGSWLACIPHADALTGNAPRRKGRRSCRPRADFVAGADESRRGGRGCECASVPAVACSAR